MRSNRFTASALAFAMAAMGGRLLADPGPAPKPKRDQAKPHKNQRQADRRLRQLEKQAAKRGENRGG
jgi:hypothetical protein